MKTERTLAALIVLIFLVFTAGSIYAADLSKAKGTVDNIRQADPPRVSQDNRTPAQAAQQYKDSGRANPGPNTLKIKEPPPPKVDRNNPTGDKDVQKGFDDHQKKYNRR